MIHGGSRPMWRKLPELVRSCRPLAFTAAASPLPHRPHKICFECEPGWGTAMADYYSVIAAVSRLPSQTDEARRAIYDRARTALHEALRDHKLPLLANEKAALDAAITTVEAVNDIRHGGSEEAS